MKSMRWHTLSGAVNRSIFAVWLPGLINLTAAESSLMILKRLGLRPQVLWVGQMPVVLYVPWLIGLPLLGAASAYLSRRWGARLLPCFAAGLFPAIVLWGLVCLGLGAMAIAGQLDRPQWLYIGVTLLNWAFLPLLALFLGVVCLLGIMKHAALPVDGEKGASS